MLAEPEKESDVALDSYRCQWLNVVSSSQPGAWRAMCVRTTEITCHEDIHLHPALTLRNLLPYSIRYLLEGSAEFHELQEGSTADVLNARIGGEIMEMVLVKYQGRNWSGRIRIAQDMQEFFPVCFTCDSAQELSVDLSVHVARLHGRLTLAVFSPYWIVNKTSRVLQYRAEDVSVKHASDFRDASSSPSRKRTSSARTSCSSVCPPVPGLMASHWIRWGVMGVSDALPTPWTIWLASAFR
ncbi:intermembrane lipid transfer protein VPS13C-like [Oncorhynchus keta]|uniref:intermembrane lipid transfer protein VPS13C-like n=1 Tax=Oncorhynchus keta TaxID=8018 RepID=UPI00227A7652|nr:intermembrane lipid transfer protein VPS13C-like [Oncorhynchus keta]